MKKNSKAKKFLLILLTGIMLITTLMMFTGCEDGDSSNKNSRCGHASCATNGPFYCMGKNNTCPNKTYCAYDYYCNSCD